MFNDNHCPVCDKPITAEHETMFRSDGTLVHAYPCGEYRLFVYGTLRKGGPLESLLPRTVFRETARAKGYAVCYPAHHRSFPYLVTRDFEFVATGELVTIPTEHAADVERIEHIIAMETNAGYTPTTIKVETKEGVYYDALAFVWTRPGVGEPVPDNDWTHAPEWEEVDYTALAVSPVVHDDEGPTLYLHSGGKSPAPFITVTDASGEHVAWSGSSYSALTKWSKENNVTLIRASHDEGDK